MLVQSIQVEGTNLGQVTDTAAGWGRDLFLA